MSFTLFLILSGSPMSFTKENTFTHSKCIECLQRAFLLIDPKRKTRETRNGPQHYSIPFFTVAGHSDQDHGSWAVWGHINVTFMQQLWGHWSLAPANQPAEVVDCPSQHSGSSALAYSIQAPGWIWMGPSSYTLSKDLKPSRKGDGCYGNKRAYLHKAPNTFTNLSDIIVFV